MSIIISNKYLIVKVRSFGWLSHFLNLFTTVPSYDTEDEMWQHVSRWSHSMEVDYRTKDGKNILTKAYFPFDPKVASQSTCWDNAELHCEHMYH